MQHMELDEIIVHEDYQINNRIHANNIGKSNHKGSASASATTTFSCRRCDQIGAAPEANSSYDDAYRFI